MASVLVYGGSGALGSVMVNTLKSAGKSVISVDLRANESAEFNIVIDPKQPVIEQANKVQEDCQRILGSNKLSGVVCVAGGWAGGNAASDELVKNTELMFAQSVWPSVISARVAAHFLQENGVVCLTGAVPALGATPGMIGYGMAKAAVHQLVKSLAGAGSGLPAGARAVAILPVTLDTPMNRKFMKDADKSTWTPLETVAQLIQGWIFDSGCPASGSLAQLRTQAGETKVFIE